MVQSKGTKPVSLFLEIIKQKNLILLKLLPLLRCWVLTDPFSLLLRLTIGSFIKWTFIIYSFMETWSRRPICIHLWVFILLLLCNVVYGNHFMGFSKHLDVGCLNWLSICVIVLFSPILIIRCLHITFVALSYALIVIRLPLFQS